MKDRFCPPVFSLRRRLPGRITMKKTLTIILSLVLVAGLCGFTMVDGIGTVYQSSERDIAPDSIFTHVTADNVSAGGVVNAYTVEVGAAGSKVKPYIFNGQVHKTYTLSSMSNIITNEGWKVVGGINGDLYDTKTGTSKGLVIHNGELITGGYQSDYILTFDNVGRAQITKPTVSYTLKFKRNKPNEDGEGSTITDVWGKATYFNVPHGGGNALHIYNYRYSDTTATSGICAEVVLTIKSGGNANLHIGDTVTAEVTSVNPVAHATPIASDQIVLSCNNKSDYYSALCQMVEGTDVQLSVNTENGQALKTATEAMGVYNMMALNGEVFTSDRTLNPRTAVGIKEDGTVVLFVVDGRQNNHSKGMTAVDVTNYLMGKGCVSVVNMDGGGSTTMTARHQPGVSDAATVVNSPSEGSLRSIANGLFFVYTGNGGDATSLMVYPAETTMLPGMFVQLQTYGVNKNFEKAGLTEPVSYAVDPAMGSVNENGVFTAGQTEGTATVTALSGNITGTTDIQIVKDVTFTVNKSSFECEPGESFDFNVASVKYGPVSVLFKDELFSWSCSQDIGTISRAGVFKASTKKADASGYITVRLGTKQVTIPVKIVCTGGFSDTRDHWAKDYINKLVELEIVNGMGDGTFGPDENLTRAQFLTMLSKIDRNENVNVAATKKFKDVPSNEWYYKVVNWGVKNHVVNGYEDGTFCPDKKVTREQMCVMLYNYYIYKGRTWTAAEKALTFKDKAKISDFATRAVVKVVSQGVMSGYPDGTFAPTGYATRGEAAKIISMIL